MKIFSFCNQKGGVGKTTTVVNLGASLAQHGKKVLIIDMDPQANATSGLGVDKKSLNLTSYQLLISDDDVNSLIIKDLETKVDLIGANKDLVGASIEIIEVEGREFLLRRRLDALKSMYDFILIDCPPSLGFLTLNALAASDGLVIPLQCEYYALEGLAELVETFQIVKERFNPNLEIAGVLLTMADFRTNLTQQVVEEVRGHFQNKTFQTVIPRSVKVSEAPSFGKPVTLYDPQSKGAVEYQKFAEEFLEWYGTSPDPENSVSNPQTSEEQQRAASELGNQIQNETQTAEISAENKEHTSEEVKS